MICVLFAMDEEVVDLLATLRGRTRIDHPWTCVEQGHHGETVITLAKSGAGKVLSALTTQHLIDSLKPSLIILCGVSGSLNPEYRRGDLVIGSEFIQHDIVTEFLGYPRGQIPFTDYRIIPAPAALVSKARHVHLSDARVHCGRIVSGDQFISGETGRALRTEFDADAVDMESAAVALVCHLNKIPFVVARTISDHADDSAVHDFSAFLAQASRHVSAIVSHLL